MGHPGTPSTDHTGRVYESFSAMARRYGLDPKTVKDRLRRGHSLEEALTLKRVYRRTYLVHVISHVGTSTRMLKEHRAKSVHDLARW